MPASQTVTCDQLRVFKIGGGPKAPSTALPLGAVAAAADPLKVSHVPVTGELTQCVLAVSHAQTPEELLTSNIAGFILVRMCAGSSSELAALWHPCLRAMCSRLAVLCLMGAG